MISPAVLIYLAALPALQQASGVSGLGKAQGKSQTVILKYYFHHFWEPMKPQELVLTSVGPSLGTAILFIPSPPLQHLE